MQSYKEYASKDWVKNQLKHIEIKDIGNSCTYVLQLKNGALILLSKAISMEITSMPEKTEFVIGEELDLTGLEVSIFREDGSKDIINNYTYTVVEKDDVYEVTIEYPEINQTWTQILRLPIIPIDPSVYLIDFNYTANSDGTYTITGWKQTLNGEPSTEMIVPNNSFIKF